MRMRSHFWAMFFSFFSFGALAQNAACEKAIQNGYTKPEQRDQTGRLIYYSKVRSLSFQITHGGPARPDARWGNNFAHQYTILVERYKEGSPSMHSDILFCIESPEGRILRVEDFNRQVVRL